MKITLFDEKNCITFSNENSNNLNFVEVQINGEHACLDISVDDLMALAVAFMTKKREDDDNQKNYE